MSAPEIFFSYSGADRTSVIAVQKLLQARGITTFLDRDNLVAGLPWPQGLEQALGQVKAVAIFIGSHLGGWQKREMWLALDRQVREEKQRRAFPVIPVLLHGADLAAGFLFLNSWIDLRGGLDGVDAGEALDAFAQAINGVQPVLASERTAVVCPYRGLQIFREEDAAFFAGRTAFAKRLLAFTLGKDLVAVVGPSGSGKSSVVQAGLVPLLRCEQQPADTWDVVNFTPGNDPFHRLASALILLLEPNQDEVGRLAKAQELGDNLAGGMTTVEAVINRVIEKSNGTGRLLLVADEFEELFTLAPEPSRRPFAQALLRALGNAPFTLLVTLRADFYGQIISLDRELSDRLALAQLNIGALTRDELRESITAPAKLVGLGFEAGLVERILADVGSEPGRLPLVEFALTELWRRREGNLLVNRAFDEIEGVTGALTQRAETEFAKLKPEERTATRYLFSRLVRVAKPDEAGEDTRQRADLCDADTLAKRVAVRLADARLLVTGAEAGAGTLSVEVAHEALIRNWDRLRGWVNEDREFLVWRQRLQVQVEEWQEHGQDAGYLLHGTPLSQAECWLRRRQQDLTDAEQRFVRGGAAVQERERKEKEWRRRRILAGIAMILLLVGCGVGYWWDWNRVKRIYYADYGLRWEVPFGVGVLSKETASHRSASYALDTRRGKVIAMRRVNGSFSLTALNGDGIDAEAWLKGVAEWRFLYRDDGKMGTITLCGPTGRIVLTEQYEFDPGGMTAAVAFHQATGRPNALAGDISALTKTEETNKLRKSQISQQRLYFNARGFVSRRMFEDGWGNSVQDSLGSFGHAYEYSDAGQVTDIRNLRKDGTVLTERNGIAQIHRSYARSGDLVGVEWRDAKGLAVMAGAQGAGTVMRLDRYGNVVAVVRYASDGRPVRDLREAWRYDDRGNKIETTYFDDNDRPKLNSEGYVRKSARFDKRGNLIEEAYFGMDGKPVLSSGFARKVIGYDERGNEVDVSYFGSDGKPVTPKSGPLPDFLEDSNYSRETKQYDDHGNLTQLAYFDADGKLTLNEYRFARATAHYDDHDNVIEAAFLGTNGEPVEVQNFFGGGGYARITASHDERGNMTQMSYYGIDGNLKLLKGITSSGYARVAWRYDGQGNQIEASYFDTALRPVIPSGWFDKDVARVTWRYDEHGNQVEEAFFGIDGKPYLSKTNGCARWSTHYDEHDKIIDEAYFGVDGKLILSINGYARATRLYDGHGNQVEEAFFGTDGSPVLHKYGHYARKTTEYDPHGNPVDTEYFGSDGKMTLHVAKRYDEHGNALETASTDARGRPILVDGIGAKAIYAYDEGDRMVNVIYFDERGREIPTEVEVIKVLPNTTAEHVKLSIGDRLLTYHGERLTCGQHLAVLTAQSGSDQRMLTVRRGNKTLSFQVPPGQLGVQLRNVRADATLSLVQTSLNNQKQP